MDRRTFASALGAALLSARAWRTDLTSMASPAEKLGPIGLQLYTVRSLMKDDLEGTLAKVGAIGYQEVEFAGYFGRTPAQIKAALDAAGLVAPGAHLPIGDIDKRWDEAIEGAKVIGHEYLVIASVPTEQRTSLAGWRKAIQLLNSGAARCRDAGLKFGYHNHEFEFKSVEGRVLYDVLVEETDRATVELEMDLYWIIKGGGKPLAYFEKYPGRFPMVHVKDGLNDAQRTQVDVGKGSINFRELFAQRAKAGMKHFFVEHDQPASPLETAKVSYEYLRKLQF